MDQETRMFRYLLAAAVAAILTVGPALAQEPVPPPHHHHHRHHHHHHHHPHHPVHPG
jgi:hypothetical protein